MVISSSTNEAPERLLSNKSSGFDKGMIKGNAEFELRASSLSSLDFDFVDIEGKKGTGLPGTESTGERIVEAVLPRRCRCDET